MFSRILLAYTTDNFGFLGAFVFGLIIFLTGLVNSYK